MAGHYILHIQNDANLVRDQFAIGVRYAIGFIDGNAHKLILSAALYFYFDDFDAFGERHTLRDLLNTR